MKKFISIMIVACMLVSAKAYTCPSQEYTFDDMETLLVLIQEEQDFKDSLHEMADIARAKDSDLHDDFISSLSDEWFAANDRQKEYEEAYNNLQALWEDRAKEYPVAAEIWTYLKNCGYSSVVCAGIMGNMMNESGNNSLNIKWNVTDYATGKTYYGICQWSYKYHKNVWGKDLQGQLNYLHNSIKDVMGSCFDSFLASESPEEAALSFAKNYERCNKGSYEKRQQNAIKAYNYFVGG